MNGTRCQIEELEGRGRGWVSLDDIEIGEEIFQSEGYSVVVNEIWILETCNYCLKFEPRKRFPKCQKCFYVAHCSEECRKCDEAHEKECKYYGELKTIVAKPKYKHFSSDFRSLLRLIVSVLVRRYFEIVEPKLNKSFLKFEDVMNLVSNFEELQKDEATRNSWEELIEVISAVLPKEYLIDSQDIIKLSCIEQCNAIGCWDIDRDMFGFGIFPLASYFNHSCSPNIKKTTKGKVAYFHAIAPIKKGEELCISYTWVDDNVEERISTLKEGFCFTCCCIRCTHEL